MEHDEHPYRGGPPSPAASEITEDAAAASEEAVICAMLLVFGALGVVTSCAAEWAVAVAFLYGGLWTAQDIVRNRSAARRVVTG